MARADRLPDERDRAIKGRVDTDDGDLAVADGDADDLDLQEVAGGVIVTDKADAEKPETSEFQENLAEELDETELDAIARDLLRKIEHDKEARRKRDEQYEEGLKRTGLGEDAPGGAQFTGASKATHPMITEACVDFHAASMKELFPPNGPVKTQIIGDQTPEQVKVADRQYKFMNWQLTEQIEEYREELAVTMTQLPMGGSQYMKFWPDATEGRTVSQFVPIDDMLIPYGCNSFWSAHRITHVQRLSEATFEDRVESEMYRDLNLAAPAETPATTKAGKASERIEGVDEPPENLDGLRIVYESNTFLRLSIDKEERLPYLITIDERTNKVLSIYRNWEEDDQRKKRLHWIVDYSFIPWRGAYKMGIAQMIGGLSAAATGSLRALLDSALVQTIPVLAKLKGAKFGSQTKTIDPMSITEIEAGVGMTDIRQVLMAMPFNPPSPVLYALLGWLTDTAKGVVTTAEEKIADAGNQMPMGTALALMESGSKVFSAIHAGLHRSQEKALKIIARINKAGVDEEAQKERFGQIICTAEDFRQPLGVIPVSDPNIFSEAQRGAQSQMILTNAQGVDPKTGQPTSLGALHDLYACVHRAYEQAKIPNIDEILPPPKKPTELNAAAENSAVMLGSLIQAFPDQDHLAHLETHMRFVADPLFGGNPIAIPGAWPPMMEHIKQHMSFLYAKTMHDLASKALGSDVGELMKEKKNWNAIDKVLAAASSHVHDELKSILEPLGPEMSTMLQKIESMKPPPPVDPGSAALQVAKMEDARERDRMKQEGGLKDKDLTERAAKDAAAAAAKTRDLDIKETDVELKHGLAHAKHEGDQQQKAHDRAHDTLKLATDVHAQEHGQNMDRQQQELAAGAQEHDQALATGGHIRDEREQQHRHELERRGADRDDTSLGHTIDLGTKDRRLKEATAAADIGMRMHGQATEQAMGAADHQRNVQNDEHARRTSEAELEQRQREHKDGLKQADKDRQASQAAARAKAAAGANSGARKPKPKKEK